MRSCKKYAVIMVLALFFLIGALTASAQSSEGRINKIERGLNVGSSGKDVAVLQRLLSSDATIYPEGLITGFFGRLTHKAVQILQDRLGFDAVGNVGPKTRAFINGLLANGNPTLLLAAAKGSSGGFSSGLNPPTSLTANAVSNQSIQLQWVDTNTKEWGHSLERSTNASINFAIVATLGAANITSYLDTGLTASTTYYYRVRAFKTTGSKTSYSAYSNVASATTSSPPDITAPTVPAGVTAVALSCSQIAVSWNASTDSGGSGLQGYNVYRNGMLFTTIFAPTMSAVDSGLASSTTYTYTVSAFDQAGNQSAQSAPVSVATPSCPVNLPPPPTATTTTFSLAIVPSAGNAFHLAGGRTISIIDTLKNEVIKTFSVGGEPLNVATTNNDKYAYVTADKNNYADSIQAVYKIDLATLILTTLNIPVDQVSSFLEVEVSPNDQYVVVVDALRTTAHFFRVADNALLKSLTLCPSCVAPKASRSNGYMAFSADSQHAYIGTPLEGLVYDIYLPTQTILQTLPFDSAGNYSSNLHDIKWNQQNGFVYTDDDYCNNYTICSVRQYDFVSGTTTNMVPVPYPSRRYADITILPDGRLVLGDNMDEGVNTTLMLVDPVTREAVQIPSSGRSLRYMIYNPTQNTVWAIAGGDRIDIFSLNDYSLRKTITPPAFGEFGWPSFSRDGKYFYMNDRVNARVVVVDTATYAVSFIPVGSNPRGVFMQGDNRIKAEPGN